MVEAVVLDELGRSKGASEPSSDICIIHSSQGIERLLYVREGAGNKRVNKTPSDLLSWFTM